MFLFICQLFFNIVKHILLSQMSFIKTLEKNQWYAMGLSFSVSGDDTADCTDLIKYTNLPGCKLLSRVWGATGFIHVKDTCSRSKWAAFLLQVMIGPLQIQQITTLYNDFILYIMIQSGLIIRSILVKPNTYYMF